MLPLYSRGLLHDLSNRWCMARSAIVSTWARPSRYIFPYTQDTPFDYQHVPDICTYLYILGHVDKSIDWPPKTWPPTDQQLEKGMSLGLAQLRLASSNRIGFFINDPNVQVADLPPPSGISGPLSWAFRFSAEGPDVICGDRALQQTQYDYSKLDSFYNIRASRRKDPEDYYSYVLTGLPAKEECLTNIRSVLLDPTISRNDRRWPVMIRRMYLDRIHPATRFFHGYIPEDDLRVFNADREERNTVAENIGAV